MAAAAGHTYSQTVIQGDAKAHLGNQYITQVAESEETTRQRLLGEARAKLAPLNFDRLRREKRPAPDTCGWIKDTEQYKAWRLSDGPPALWIHGKPGCGKTVIASTIIKSLEENEIVLFYFCVGADGLSRTAEAVVRTLLCQILDHPKLRAIQAEALNYLSPVVNMPSMSLDALCNCLARIFILMPTCSIVLDGLDEVVVEGENRDFLLESILSLTRTTTPQHKPLFLSRPEVDLREVLRAVPSIRIHNTDNEADIGRFIGVELARLQWISQIEGIRDRVAEKLTDGANGMFLWVRLMLDTLKRATTTAEVEELLENLPRGLDSMYLKIFQQLAAQSTPEETRWRKLILTWITTVVRPLSVDELTDALAMDVTSRVSRNDWKFLDPEVQILRMCASLVQITGNLVQLTHFSVKEYLCRAEAETASRVGVTSRDTASSPHLCIDIQQANTLLASVCITYFLRDDLCGDSAMLSDTSVVGIGNSEKLDKFSKIHPLLQYSTIHWADHLLLSCDVTAELLKQVEEFQRPRSCLTWIVAYRRYAGVGEKLSILLRRIETWSARQKQMLACVPLTNFDDSIASAMEFGWRLFSETFGAANERGLVLARDLYFHYVWRHRHRDAELICRRMLQACADADAVPSRMHLIATVNLAECAGYQGRPLEIINLLEGRAETYVNILSEDARLRHQFHTTLGRAYYAGDPDNEALEKAVVCFENARTAAHDCSDSRFETLSCEYDLGVTYTRLGRLEEAQHHLDVAYKGFVDIYGINSYYSMRTLLALARLQKAQQRLPQAIETMKTVLEWTMENDSPAAVVHYLGNLGYWYHKSGDLPQALLYTQMAFKRSQAEDYPDTPYTERQMKQVRADIEKIEGEMATQGQQQKNASGSGRGHGETAVHSSSAITKDRLKGFGKMILSIGRPRRT